MPRPADSETKYLPGLDGIRAIAVAAVVGYHLGAPWLPGGLLGVGVFFTLSGYLITTILISTWDRSGNLDLGHFWVRRARRLLPALIMVLIVVLVATPVLDNDVLPERGIEALAALLTVGNWTAIASDVSYFERPSLALLIICGRLRSRNSSTCCGPWCCCCSSRLCAAGWTGWHS